MEALLGLLTLVCGGLAWLGVWGCSPFHPCGVGWQFIAGMGFAAVSIFGNALALLLIWRSALEAIRRMERE